MTEKSDKRDVIYSQTLEKVTDFVFDESVVQVFKDMIGRSVPGYGSLLSMMPVLINRYVMPDSQCYDLGCSLGAVTLAMRHSIHVDGVKIVAVDNSSAMVEKCRAYIENDKSQVPVDIKCDDIRNSVIENASFVALNFTLQFIEPAERMSVIEKIYSGMNKNGVLLMSEKISFEDDKEQQWMSDLHVEFKKANGYSDMEISQKRSALDNVLIPETLEQHKKRLKEAGFEKVMVWFQCFNFISVLAIK
ncbi:MAG: carboxy-S-adenosyl-L-methionine synthase CmoA [Gammaproteobacteria bacterium]|nr:carboxy-S-adenosyl-L-methionine synthase CmoA [Gammaproteobacteria bacterium]MCW9004288.1 carboxy-S-adenosyl-L-methionine synthase CmoA [Gammaproteobacteria bacterium]